MEEKCHLKKQTNTQFLLCFCTHQGFYEFIIVFVLRIFVSPLVSVTAISYTDHKQEYMDQSPWRPWGLSLENWPELYKHLKKKNLLEIKTLLLVLSPVYTVHFSIKMQMNTASGWSWVNRWINENKKVKKKKKVAGRPNKLRLLPFCNLVISAYSNKTMYVCVSLLLSSTSHIW